MANILVTGGAGFIGSHSVERLLGAGHRVRVLDDLSTGKPENLPRSHDLRLLVGDVRDLATVEQAMDGIDRVLHLAAQVFVPASIAEPVHSSSINVTGFLNVLDVARRRGVTRVVYASSAAVYGVPATLPVTEQTPPQALSPYGLEKLIDDQYASLFEHLYGISTCGLRYFNVYGPRQDPRSAYSGVISKFCARAAADEPLTIFGDGLQTRDFISVFDVARANEAALFGAVTGVVNVATGTSVTLLQLIDALRAAWRKPLPIDHQPGRDGEVRDSAVDPRRLRDELGLSGLLTLQEGLDRLVASLQP